MPAGARLVEAASPRRLVAPRLPPEVADPGEPLRLDLERDVLGPDCELAETWIEKVDGRLLRLNGGSSVRRRAATGRDDEGDGRRAEHRRSCRDQQSKVPAS